MGKVNCSDVLLDNKLPTGKDKILPEVIVTLGDDGFLRSETTSRILSLAGIERDDAKLYDGEECQWIDVHDELATLSLFDCSRRVCIVAAADKLVKDNRPKLEKWCQAPAQDSLLILSLNSLASNTKLFKLAQSNGVIVECTLPTGGGKNKTPSATEVKKWIQAWGAKRHSLKISGPQAKLVLDAVGPDCGLLHQELSKLALYSDNDTLTDELIRTHVGSWRTRTMWEIADAVADGRVTDALEQLHRVFAAGEHPAAVVPQISWSLRRFGAAANQILQAKRIGHNVSARAAVGACGFWGRDVQLAEQRLRRMGLRRAGKLLDWLLELDLKIKGSHSTPARAIFALEELCMRLA